MWRRLHLCVIISFLVVASLHTIFATPNGAPENEAVCMDLMPRHGVPPQISASPYTIILGNRELVPGGDIMVTLSSGNGTTFKGFAVQGRKVGGMVPAGMFKTAGPDVKPHSCGPFKSSGITHTHNKEKTEVKACWRAPTGAEAKGTYQLLATFLKDGYTFWVGQYSDVINVV